jgi:hypothetical protein
MARPIGHAFERFGELWAVGTLAAFNFDQLGNELAVHSIEMIAHRVLLRLKAKAGYSLLPGRDTIIAHA